MIASYEAKPSEIHGNGIFAKRTIRRGEFIGQYLSRRTDSESIYTLWVEFDDGERGYEGYGRLRFVNHSLKPNAEFRDRNLHAIRTIREGDEITTDYGDDWIGIE